MNTTPQTMDLLSMLKNMLLQNYQPATNDTKAMLMSTREVYDALQAVYPTESFTMVQIAEWLAEAGFQLEDLGELRLLWKISRKQ